MDSLEKDKIGKFYNIGGYNEKTNISTGETICDILDKKDSIQKGSLIENRLLLSKTVRGMINVMP